MISAPAKSPVKQWILRLAAQRPKTARILMRAIGRSMQDGYVHAGNIAYLSLVTLLPFAILITAVTVAFGQTEAGTYAIDAILQSLPNNIAEMFKPVIDEVLTARTGSLLWAGGLVALWTVTTFVETLRDIHYRAFDVTTQKGFLRRRLQSMGGTILAIILVLIIFILQIVLVLMMQELERLLPVGIDLPAWIDLPRLISPVVLFGILWALLKLLTPRQHRHNATWPGAAITTMAWVSLSLMVLPIFSSMGGMGLTYGALSGVMVALLFFYVVGFALVIGVELNAALAHFQKSD